jgi:2,3-bisphosphoglycerate-dependent phosphoglycerate mutase
MSSTRRPAPDAAEQEPRHIVLVKHALPTLEAGVPARRWQLAPEGEHQARRLARELLEFEPFRLVASQEPKAARTAEIVGAELALPFTTHAGLVEFDRPALPLLSQEDHAAINAPIFEQPSRRVLGDESGAEALARFSHALTELVAETPEERHVVAVTHGTVIALLVAAHNRVDGFELWRRLACPSFVVLAWPNLELLELMDRIA